MKFYLKVAAFLMVAGAIGFFFLLIKEASKTESVIIAGEQKKLAGSIDAKRFEKDAEYRRSIDEKIAFLDYRLAIAFNSENKPDEAIAVLKRLINAEEAKSQRGAARRSRSYFNEAEYYETLIEAFEMKKDEASVKTAAQSREELLRKASELKKNEEREEGRSIGLSAK